MPVAHYGDVVIVDTRFSEQLNQRLEDTVRNLAQFDPGDHVTVEPPDHDIPYAGSYLEGVPLEIEHLVLRADTSTGSLATIRSESERERPHLDDYPDDAFVPVDDVAPDEWLSDDTQFLLITDIACTVTHPDVHTELSESALIHWDEFRSQHQRHQRIRHVVDEPCHRYAYTERNPEDDPCPVCGSHWRTVRGCDEPPGLHSEDCAVCGESLVFVD